MAEKVMSSSRRLVCLTDGYFLIVTSTLCSNRFALLRCVKGRRVLIEQNKGVALLQSARQSLWHHSVQVTPERL